MVLLAIPVILIVLFLFMIFPSVGREDIKNPFRGLMVAHRGLWTPKEQIIPENSMAAFRAAIDKNYGIETDLRFTKDKEVVLFHDNTLKRMCGCDIKVSDLTLEELKAFTLADTNETVPTLKEFLALVDGKVHLILEFKADYGEEAELCSAAEEILADYKGQYCIESFNPIAVRWYKKNRKNVCRGQLAMKSKEAKLIKVLAGSFMLNFLARPDFAAYDMCRPKDIFFRLQKLLGAMPVGWTIVSKKQLDSLKNTCDSYIFEGFEP